MKKTALIILNYNNCEDTGNCIDSVFKYNKAPVKFIVVDNASNKNQREGLIRCMETRFGDEYVTFDASTPGWHEKGLDGYGAALVLSDDNLGYGRGNNLGLMLAYSDESIDTVMILNNDILFVQDIVPDLLSRLKLLPDCGIISPVLYKRDMQGYDFNCARRNEQISEMIGSNVLHYWRRFRHKSSQQVYPHRYILPELLKSGDMTCPIELPSGSCMLIDKDLFRQIGSFDPNTFLYYEENILYSKLSRIGKRNYICLDLPCIHLGAATTSSLPKSSIVVKAGVESQSYYVQAYSGAPWVMRMLHWLSAKFFLASFRVQKALSFKR